MEATSFFMLNEGGQKSAAGSNTYSSNFISIKPYPGKHPSPSGMQKLPDESRQFKVGHACAIVKQIGGLEKPPLAVSVSSWFISVTKLSTYSFFKLIFFFSC